MNAPNPFLNSKTSEHTMKQRFAQVLHLVYCEPWLIRPEVHATIRQILNQHVTGLAHQPGGVALLWNDEDNKDKPKEPYAIVDNVAVIEISGVLGKRIDEFDRMSGVTDVDDTSRALALAAADRRAAGIVLSLDTPGGSVTGIPELAEKIKETSNTKPVVAFTDTMAASAGYWLASQASAIITAPSAVLGSIGVYLAVLDRSVQYQLAGVKQDVIKAGRYKGAGIPGTSLSEDQRAMLQGRVDHVFEEFKNAVRSGRAPRQIADETMQGQDFFGRQSIALGLADGFGDIADAIDMAKTLAAGGTA